MKKQRIKKLNFSKSSISNLANKAIGGLGNRSYVCPTNAADRPGCPSFAGLTCEPTRK